MLGIVKLKPRWIYSRFGEPFITYVVNVTQGKFKWIKLSMKIWLVF